MGFFGEFKNFFIPTASNAYRPGILGRRSLIVFLGVILAAEGFLVANLTGRSSISEYLAAVIGSEIITLTNTQRVEAAESTLSENTVLDAAAQAKADDMAAKSYFSHVGPDGKEPWAWISEAGYDYTVAGENLAVRFVDSDDVVKAWMASPTHKANIVKPSYTEIGVGIAQGMYKGSSATFVVQFFGTPHAAAAGVAAAAPFVPAGQSALSAAAPANSPAPEVAGESVAAAPATSPPPAATAPHPQSPLESFMRVVLRMFAEPRATTALLLGSVAVLLILAVVLAFIVHIEVQPVELLLRGSLVALFALFLVVLNGQMLAGAENQSQAAAVGAGGSQTSLFLTGLVIDDAGVSMERFIIEPR